MGNIGKLFELATLEIGHEFRTLRNRIALLILSPFLILTVGIFLASTDKQKLVALLLVMTASVVAIPILAFRSLPIVLAAGGIETNAIKQQAEWFGRFTAGVVASELAIGLLVYYLPVEREPLQAWLMAIAGIAIFSYGLAYNVEATWWRTIVFGLPALVFFITAFKLFFIGYFPEDVVDRANDYGPAVSEWTKKTREGFEGVVRGTAPISTFFRIVFTIISLLVAVKLALRGQVTALVFLGLLVLTVNYFWGSITETIERERKRVSSPPVSSVPSSNGTTTAMQPSMPRPPADRPYIATASKPGYRGDDTIFLRATEGKLIILYFTPGEIEEGTSQWFHIPRCPIGQSIKVNIGGGSRNNAPLVQQLVSDKLIYNYIAMRTDMITRDNKLFPSGKVIEMPLYEVNRLNEGGRFRLLGSLPATFSMWCE